MNLRTTFRRWWKRIFWSRHACNFVISGCEANDHPITPALCHPGDNPDRNQAELVRTNDAALWRDGHPLMREVRDFTGAPKFQEAENGHETASPLYRCRTDLRAVRLSFRQLQMAELLLDLCLGKTRGVALFPRLNDLGTLMGPGVERSHVHRWLNDLAGYGIIVIAKRGRRSGWQVSFQPDRRSWSVIDRRLVNGTQKNPKECEPVSTNASDSKNAVISDIHIRRYPVTEPIIKSLPATHRSTVAGLVTEMGTVARTNSLPERNGADNERRDTMPLSARVQAKPPSVANQLLCQGRLMESDQLSTKSLPISHPKVTELLEKLAAIMGPEWPTYENFWRGRCRKFPAAVEEAVDELKVRMEHPTLKMVAKPGGWLNGEFRRILGETPMSSTRLRKTSQFPSKTPPVGTQFPLEIDMSSPDKEVQFDAPKPADFKPEKVLSAKPCVLALFPALKASLQGGTPRNPFATEPELPC